MNLYTLTGISLFVFLTVFISILFAFSKSEVGISRWSILIALFAFALIISWHMTDFATQWVLIEACTLLGALLISMSKTEKATNVAWKFLFLNSFGMGIAFLGLIILSYGVKNVASMNIQVILSNIQAKQNLIVEIGIWLAVFGYSTKLGLVPNQYWVIDTYSESPSQISSLIASLIPVSVCIALRPIVKMDDLMLNPHFSAKNALLVMGIASMIYSILTLYQARDIRIITSLVAMFHNGAIAVFLWLNVSDSIFYLAMSSLVVIKVLIFGALGVLRLDLSSRIIDEIKPTDGLHPLSKIIYLGSIFMAFALPFSPMFLSDMMAMRMAVNHSFYWYSIVPCFGIIFFAITLHKILPLMNLEPRDFISENKKILQIRISLVLCLFLFAILLGGYGFYLFSSGGFDNV